MNIKQAFEKASAEGRAAFIPYMTAGFPDPDTFLEIVSALDKAGADIIEIGLPFSDPSADGPVIQTSSQHVLDMGMTPGKVLELTAEASKRTSAALVIMTYYNPIHFMGHAEFAAAAKAASVSGTIIPDLPLEEAGDLIRELDERGIDNILLAAPNTTPQRLALLSQNSRGFLYYVSITGVTGADLAASSTIAEDIRKVREISPVPVAVGFGVSTPDTAGALAREADGVIVGSALIREVQNQATPEEQTTALFNLASSLRNAMSFGPEGKPGRAAA